MAGCIPVVVLGSEVAGGTLVLVLYFLFVDKYVHGMSGALNG
jgi:hypothetical protein